MNDNNVKNAFKAGIWYTVSTLLIKSISIISTPLYTRLMSTSDYGISATFNTWYALLSIICSLNVGYSIGRAKVDFGEKFEKYIGALQVICATVTIVLFGLFFIVLEPFQSIIGLNRKSVFWLFLYVLFGTIVSINQGKYRFRYQYKQNIFISFFISIATIVFSLLFIMMLPEKYMGKIIGTALPIVILGIYFWGNSIKNKNITLKREFFSYALVFSIPLIIHSLSIYVLGQSDRLMIKYFCGNDFVGIYSLVHQYAILITLVTNSINQAWNPWFHDNYALGNCVLIREKVTPLILLGCYIGVGCVGIAPEAIRILGGENYLDGLGAVVPITLGVIIEFVYTQYIIIEMHLKKTKYVSLGTGIAAVINLALNYICIPKFGYIAAAYTTLVSYLVLLIIHHVITRMVLHIHLYQDKKMYVMIITTMCVCFGLSMIYDYAIYRYLILVIMTFAFALYNKEFILNKIKGRKITC